MKDEPDVVKELKEAEKFGLFQSKVKNAIEELKTVETPLEKTKKIVGFFKDIGESKTVNNGFDQTYSANSLDGAVFDFQDFFKNVNDLIQVVRPDGTFLYVNSAWKKKLGYTDKEIKKLKVFEIIHPSSKEHCMAKFRCIMSGEKVDKVKAIFVSKNDKEIVVEGSINCRFDNGKPVYTRGIFRDITKQMKIEEALKQSEKKYKRLFESSPDLIIEIDEKGNILAVNPIMAKSLGASSDTLIGRNIFNILPRDTSEKRTKIARNALEKMKNLECYDERAGRYFHNIYVPIINPDGRKTIQLIVRDITAQKEAEKALMESNEKLMKIINSSPDNITISDLNGNIIDCNQATLDMHGFSKKEDIIGKNALELIAPKDHEKAMEYLKKTLDLGLIKNIEYAFLKKDGSEFPAEISASIIRDSSGKPISFIGVIKDITERKKREMELQEMNQYLENLFNYANAPIIVWNPQFVITRFNHAFESLIGRSANDAIGKPIEILFPPDKMKSSMELIRKMQGMKQLETIEIDVQHIDGSIRTILWNSATIFISDNKNLVATIAQGQDITERLKAEEALYNSEEKLNSIIESSSDQIFMLNNDYKFLSVNKTAANVFRKLPREMIGKSILEIFPENIAVQFSKNIKNVFDTGKSIFIDEKMVDQDREFYSSTSLNPIKNNSGRVVAVTGIVRDITERKKMEEDLEKFKIRIDMATEASQIGIWELDLINDTSVRNLIHDQIFGYNKNIYKWGAKIFFEHIIPEERPFVQAAFDSAMKTNKLYFECQILWPNKSVHYITVSGKVVRDNTGKPQKMLGTVIDITNRKKAEKDLKEKIEQLERYKKITVNRELKMVELKMRIKELEAGVKTEGRR